MSDDFKWASADEIIFRFVVYTAILLGVAAFWWLAFAGICWFLGLL